jgi:uroporphyrin-3 C-methyltransferase
VGAYNLSLSEKPSEPTVSEPNSPMQESPDVAAPAPGREPAVVMAAAPAQRHELPRWWWALLGAALLLSIVAAALAWQSQQRAAQLERELVRRQEASHSQATMAQLAAQQSQDQVRDALAKLAVLDARVAEVAVQRSQIEELIASLSRSRDENLLVDIEAGLRVAMQQSAITSSSEPLVAMLRQSDERLARYKQPRLEGVRRAIARDLDRVRSVGSVDVSALVIRLDEAVRLVDDLPLVAAAPSRLASVSARQSRHDLDDPEPAAEKRSAAPQSGGWSFGDWKRWAEVLWQETRALVRVSRIDQPDAMLLAPEQSFFLRENLKLRLLNARLALLSRQYDTAQADLQLAQAMMDRYFDRSARRSVLAKEALQSVAAQARQVVLARPDDTLAALSTLGVGR